MRPPSDDNNRTSEMIRRLGSVAFVLCLSPIAVFGNRLLLQKLLHAYKYPNLKAALIIFLFNSALIFLGTVLFHLKKKPVMAFKCIVVSTVASILFIGLILRQFPMLLGESFANGILGKYNADDDGIYQCRENPHFCLMKPDFNARMRWNGHSWIHQTDKWGFRNPIDRERADVLLLGDSIIYGHGVDQEKTVGAHLEKDFGLSVMNMAREGDSAFSQMVLLNTYIGIFKPKYVVQFYFENDIYDLYFALSDAELRKFIENDSTHLQRLPIPFHSFHYARKTSLSLFKKLVRRPALLRYLDYIKSRNNINERYTQFTASPSHSEFNEQALGWKFTKKAVLKMKEITEGHGAKFILAPVIPLPEYAVHREILRNFSKRNHILFVDTSPIDFRDQSLFLPKDGHLNDKGAKTLAQIVSDFIVALKPRNRSVKQKIGFGDDILNAVTICAF